MNHALFFLCPVCLSEESLQKSKCINCHTQINLHGDQLFYNSKTIGSAQYYDFLLNKLSIKSANNGLPPEIGLDGTADIQRISQGAVLRQGVSEFNFYGYHGLFKRAIEKPQRICEGYMVIYEEYAEFISESETFKWFAKDFSCVTTNGHYFEFKIVHQPFFQIRFLNESPLKYEIIFRKWLRQFYRNLGKKNIVEFQPRLIFSPPGKSRQVLDFSAAHYEKGYLFEKFVMVIIKILVNTIFRFFIRVKVLSKENWKTMNGGFAILNHQSGLDPFIVGAFLDRKIAFLTKNTAFNNWMPRLFLRWNMGVPTTRYQPDPPVIYLIRRLLKRGIKIGIFPEGERTWGGKMHPFKLGVIRLLMASREEITPVILKNAFEFWPRWAKLPRRAEVQILVGAPFCLIPKMYPVAEQQKFLEEYFRTYLNES